MPPTHLARPGRAGCRRPVGRQGPGHSAPRVQWLVGLLLLLGAPRPAAAIPHDGQPKILLHSMSVNIKNVCGRGALGDCRDAVTAGTVGVPSYVYLLGVKGSLPTVSAVECGLTYQANAADGLTDGIGVDIFSWTRCATLEFSSPGPRPWPSSGSGNIVVYDAYQACQAGETAVMGYLYVSAYSPDVLYLVARPSSAQASVTDCGAVTTPLAPSDLGAVAFTTAGGTEGCNPCLGPCPEPPPPPPARCELTVATNTTFPTVRVHDGNNHRKLTIKNVGGQRMTGHLTLSSDQFRMWSGINSYSLAAGESKEFWVTFQPSDVGDHEAELTTGADCPPLHFSGRAVPYAECYIGPVNAQLSETRIGDFREVTVTVQNRGPGPVSGTLFLSNCSPDFTLIGNPDFSLAWGEWAELRLRFAPTRTEMQTCGIQSTTFCFSGSIRGSGYVGEPTPPACWINRTLVDFGEVVVGQNGDASFHVANTGGGILHLEIAPSCPQFRPDHSFPPRMNLYVGEQGVVRLEFAPTEPGPLTCQLQMADCSTVTLTGVGRLPGPGLLEPASVDFGVLPAGSASERTFTVTNTGSERIGGSIRSNRPEFTLVGADTYDLQPGASASFRVRFQSPEAGEHRGTLDAGTQSSMLPLVAVTEAVTGVQPATWSAIKSRFGR